MLSYGESGSFLYHYTRLATAIEHIIPSQRLALQPFAGMNDPREAREWNVSTTGSGGNRFGVKEFWNAYEVTNRLKQTCKLVCFTADATPDAEGEPEFARGYARPRMWAHYAEDHRGVCLLFDRDALHERLTSTFEGRGELFFGSVAYADRGIPLHVLDLNVGTILDRGLESVLDSLVKSHSTELFFSKARDWATETEVRYLLRTPTEGAEFVSIEGTLRAVCMGDALSPEYEPSLRSLCTEFDLDLLKIEWDNGRPIVLTRPKL